MCACVCGGGLFVCVCVRVCHAVCVCVTLYACVSRRCRSLTQQRNTPEPQLPDLLYNLRHGEEINVLTMSDDLLVGLLITDRPTPGVYIARQQSVLSANEHSKSQARSVSDAVRAAQPYIGATVPVRNRACEPAIMSCMAHAC